jgi:hypothetical protein
MIAAIVRAPAPWSFFGQCVISSGTEAFVCQKAIDEATYQEMRVKLTQDLTLAEMELREAQAERNRDKDRPGLRCDGLTNAWNLWKTAPSEQKQRLQQVLFPEGVTYSEEEYRTTVTCLLFSGVRNKRDQK